MKKIIILIAAALLFCSAGEADNNPPTDYMVERFFSLYETSGAEKAIDYICGTNLSLAGDRETIENIKSQYMAHIMQQGEYCGYETLSRTPVGESLIHYICMARHEGQPVKFIFIFYKARDIWVIQSFKFEGNPVDEIDRLVNAKLIN